MEKEATQKRYTRAEMFARGRELGATHIRIFSVKQYGRTHIMTTHFFNKFDIEVGYFCEDLFPLTGFTEITREWSEWFKNHPAYEREELSDYQTM